MLYYMYIFKCVVCFDILVAEVTQTQQFHNTPYFKMAAILVFFCLLENEPLLPCLRENILLNFEFKSEAERANLQVNKRILKWWPFWNNTYIIMIY